MLDSFITYTSTFLRIQDILDIIIVAIIIYNGIRLLRDTRAVQLIKGIGILLVVMLVSEWLKLHVTYYLLTNTMQVGVIAVIILFQPELRRALERMGRSSLSKFLHFEDNDLESNEQIIEEICVAADELSKEKTGALIVFERETKIGEVVKSGIEIDSKVSAKLMLNIFEPKTPLHDGAVVIRDKRITAAACFLPMTQNNDLNTELGARHRAALGITEASDAVVVIVSEETGRISVAIEGSLTRNLTVESLGKVLAKFLVAEPVEKSHKIHKLRKKEGTGL